MQIKQAQPVKFKGLFIEMFVSVAAATSYEAKNLW
jgi:hypothetical protein